MAARILIVEDNPANLELMTYLLGASGYPTLSARDGVEGLRIAIEELPDLIICDVQLPKMSAYEMAQQVKRRRDLCGIPPIAITAFARVCDRAEAPAAGFDGYFSKPIDPETFVQQLEAILRPDLRLTAPVRSWSVINPIPKPRPRARTVLVVDNVQADLDLSASLLEYSGLTAVTARGPKEALRLARQARPDLILSDICMPGSSGYDFIQFKNDHRLSSIPFIFITSTATTERDRLHGLALGAAKFLLRPIEPQQLLKEVEDCLAQTDEP
jgi:two-component system cell cycle response regulator